ncbi:MAG: SBBP repeat-containing protein [Bacteroidetes bacterium]|nr:SBBP repeat-containing protein [Bacteroidota bacterium]
MIGTKYLGELPISKPISYQITASGERKYLQTIYVQNGNTFSYKVLDPIDPSLELIIDPQLKYSTFLFCLTCDDYSFDIDANQNGKAVATGFCRSSGFPTTSGSYQISIIGAIYVFTSVLNDLGSNLIFSTFLGGSSIESGSSVTFDLNENVVVTGYTNSNNYPIIIAAQSTKLFGTEAFVSKISSLGNSLIFSTFLGGDGIDVANSVCIDKQDNVLVCGFTKSLNFPVTTGVIKAVVQPNSNGLYYEDGFITKYNSIGNLLYSTYIGGTKGEQANSIVTDLLNNIYVGGTSESIDFARNSSGYDTTINGYWDGFVMKLNQQLNSVIYFSYIGGSINDQLENIAIDKYNNVYAVGVSNSTNFPLTLNVYKDTLESGDGYIVCLDSSGKILKHSTAIGNARLYGIGLNDCGSVFVSGYVYSRNYPITSDAFSNFKGFMDNVITVLDSALSQLLYSTFVGK